MSTKKDNIILVSDKVIYNPDKIIPFQNFSIEDAKLLYSTLFENNINNLMNLKGEFNLYLILNDLDKAAFAEYSKSINLNDFNLQFYEAQIDYNQIFENLKFFGNTIIIYSDVMGISENSITEIRNLLNSIENSIVLGNSKINEICLVGCNHISENMITSLQNCGRNYTEFLSLINTEEYFINSMNDYLRVSNVESFKELYNDLSSKKSIEYCSQEFHEKFTHLFVEYKDLLK